MGNEPSFQAELHCSWHWPECNEQHIFNFTAPDNVPRINKHKITCVEMFYKKKKHFSDNPYVIWKSLTPWFIENARLEVHRLVFKVAGFWFLSAYAESKQNTQIPLTSPELPLKKLPSAPALNGWEPPLPHQHHFNEKATAPGLRVWQTHPADGFHSFLQHNKNHTEFMGYETWQTRVWHIRWASERCVFTEGKIR